MSMRRGIANGYPNPGNGVMPALVHIDAPPAMTNPRASTSVLAWPRVPIGIRHMAVGAFWFSLMSVCVKLAGRRLPSMEIVFFRGLLTLGLSYAIIRRQNLATPWGAHRPLLVLRGTLGAAALCCFMFSLTHLPLGEATLIQYTNPVFAIIIAALWFRERMRAAEFAALAGALAGVVMVTRPSFLFGGMGGHIPVNHALIALLGAAFAGSAYATIRRLRGEHPDVVVFYLPLMQIPMSLPFVASSWLWPTPSEWLLLIGMALATQLAQLHMTRGLQVERTARATTTGYLQIVFAGVWGALIFGEHPGAWTIVGALIILASTVALVVLHPPAEKGSATA
jgi:drug/metabolite transporter (DMT)-like permease